MLELRPYQEDAVNKTVEFLDTRNGNPLVVAPTGSGKSLMIAALCTALRREANKKILILAHRKELLVQNNKAIEQLNVDAKVVYFSAALKSKSLDGDIIIAGISSIARKHQSKLPHFDYLIIDEAHLVNNENEGMYRKLINHYSSSRIIGLSATPFRMKGGYLHTVRDAIFTEIVVDIPITGLMEEGFLSRLTSKASAVEVDLSDLHVRGGEFIQEEYDERFNDDELIALTVQDMIKHAGDRQSWIIFCCSIDHAYKVGRELQQNGVTCLTVTGETPQEDRDIALKLFKERKIKAITNCDVLTTGFDAPNIDVIVLLRPTKSCGLYIQMVGRGARLYEGKKNCMVLDYGHNIHRFGPIDKIKLKKGMFDRIEAEEPKMKTCPECREVIEKHLKICPECHYEYPVPDEKMERKIKHSYEASGMNIIQGNAFDGNTWLPVAGHKVSIHYKENSKPSLRVDYFVGGHGKVSEWICIEHYGYPREMAHKWWYTHCKSYEAPPTNIEDAIWRAGFLKYPDRITATYDGKYYKIIKKDFGDKSDE